MFAFMWDTLDGTTKGSGLNCQTFEILSLTSYRLLLDSFISFKRGIFIFPFDSNLVDRLVLKGVKLSGKPFDSGGLEWGMLDG